MMSVTSSLSFNSPNTVTKFSTLKAHGEFNEESQPNTGNNVVPSPESSLLSRRKSLRNIFGIVSTGTFFLSSTKAQAAIPTIDDYESTANGAKIVSSTKLTASEEELIKNLKSTSPLIVGDKSSLIKFIDASVSNLNALDSLVKSTDWATVRAVLRAEGIYSGNAVGLVRKTNFGDKKLKKAMFSDSIEDAREDFAFSLGELEDFALENRSVFFNSVDRKQIDELIAETGYSEDSNRNEGLKLLQACKKNAAEFRKIALE